MQTGIKKYEVRRIRPRCNHRTTIERLTRDIKGPYGLFIEAIMNSVSPERGNAQHVWITVSGRGDTYEVTILDDGRGMNEARQERFLNMAFEDEKVQGRNYQGLGSKRMAAEFTDIIVHTVAAEEQQADPRGYRMWVLKMNFDDLFEIFATDADRQLEFKPRRPDWKQLDLPPGSSGVRIHLTGPREGRPRFTAAKLCRELPHELPPWVAERVFINGEPLEKRQIIGGQEIRMKRDDHPTLGRVMLDLYIPKTKSPRDRLTIGPFEGIWEWDQFHQAIDEEVRGDRLNILSDGVFGDIYVESFAPFVTSSRMDFESSLFATPLVPDFVEFLEHEVVPQVEQLMGVVQQAKVSERDQRLLAQIEDYLSVLSGEEEQPEARPSVLVLDTSAIEMVRNQRMPAVIKVDTYNPDLTLAWDVSRCGGRCEVAPDCRSIQYWPGDKFGGYNLACFYQEEPTTRRTVDIMIVAAKKLRVDPARRTTAPHRPVRLRAVNYQDDSSGAEHLRWHLSADDTEGRFIVTVKGERKESPVGYGPEVEYLPGYTLGTFRVFLADTQNALHKKEVRLQAFAGVPCSDITVAPPSGGGGGGKGGSGRGVVIEGTRYRVGFDYMEHAPFLSKVYGSGEQREIKINRSHRVSRHVERVRGDDALVELAIEQALMQHIDYQEKVRAEQMTDKEKTRRFADLYFALIEAYEQRDAASVVH